MTFSPDEVAKVASVTRRTVYAWIKDGKLPAHKVGPKKWVVHQRVLVAFMEGEQPDMLRAIASALNMRTTVMPVLGAAARAEALQEAHKQEIAKKKQQEQEQLDQQAKLAALAQPQPQQPQPPKLSIWQEAARNKTLLETQAELDKAAQAAKARPAHNQQSNKKKRR